VILGELPLDGAAFGLRTLLLTTRKNIPLGYSSVPAVKNPSGRILPGLTMGSSDLAQPPIYPAAKSALKDFHLRESCTEQKWP